MCRARTARRLAALRRVRGLGLGQRRGAGGAALTARCTLAANGGYTYTLNNALPAVQALTAVRLLTDTFTYTMTDDDGDTSTTTLTITINGANDAPTVTVPQAGAPDDGGRSGASGAAGRAGRFELGGELGDHGRYVQLHQWRRRLDGDDQRRERLWWVIR